MSADPFHDAVPLAPALVGIGTSLPDVPAAGGIFFEVAYGQSLFTIYIAPPGGKWKKMTLNQPVSNQGLFGNS